jgi:outer membrane protein assembly factor BamB
MTALSSLLLLALSAAEDWTRFRGPNGSGVSKDTGFPAGFSKDKNLQWRTPVRAGKSSPVLTDKHVFLTAAEDGKLFTQCLDRKTGKLLWERFIDQPRTEQVNALNHSAALSPVTDGDNVYVFFKDFGLLSYDSSGKLRWKSPLGPFTNVMGLGASPILAGDRVIVLVDQVDDSYIAAFDKKNGEARWKTPREEVDSWGSPLLYTPPGSQQQPLILTVGRGQIGTHRISDGKRLLSQAGIPPTIVASPILDGNHLYFFGYGSEAPSPFASRLARLDKNKDGQLSPDEYGEDAFTRGVGKYKGNRDGIVTQQEWDDKQRETLGLNGLFGMQLDASAQQPPKELWRYEKSFSYIVPTLLAYNGILYSVKNGGILSSFDASTGKLIKTGRIDGATGGYSASPVAADGKLYFAGEDGKVAVLKATGEWEVLTTADLDEPIFATPALSGGSIFLRTGSALYRFGTR